MGFNKLFYWYFSKKTLPYWGIIIIDCLLIYFSLMLVSAFGTTAMTSLGQMGKLSMTAGIYTLLYVVGLRIFHTYSGIIRYSSFVDLLRVAKAVGVGAALSIIFKLFIGDNDFFFTVRIRDILLSAVMAMVLMWGLRVVVKYIYDMVFLRDTAERIFIFGVKEGGIGIAKSIRNQDPARYVLAGFTTDREDALGRILMDVKVYPFDETLIDEMHREGATALFVSPLRSAELRERQDMVDLLIKNDIKIFMTPTEQEWDGHSEIEAQHIREVSIEDLLPRQEIEIDIDEIASQLRGKRILITGAAGSIGSEIVRQTAAFAPSRLILIDQAETPLHDIRLMMSRKHASIPTETIVADITNQSRMAEIFETHKPEFVFHAAAYKHVPMMEDNPGESVRNNVQGTRVLADLAVAHGVSKFVMISTDKAVNPTNVMGCSKRICEIYVQSLDKAVKDGMIGGSTQFVTTRFGNVLGSNGSVIPIFKEQIKNGGPVTVTHPDIIRFFMLISEACKLVLEAGIRGHGGEIFVFDMGKPVKIVDLAKRMIQLSRTNCEIKFTGLRKGEKLYEEVLANSEESIPSFHPKINIARVREYDYGKISAMIDVLAARCEEFDDMEIVRHMKLIVPEFKSQNSKYEVLD